MTFEYIMRSVRCLAYSCSRKRMCRECVVYVRACLCAIDYAYACSSQMPHTRALAWPVRSWHAVHGVYQRRAARSFDRGLVRNDRWRPIYIKVSCNGCGNVAAQQRNQVVTRHCDIADREKHSARIFERRCVWVRACDCNNYAVVE